jgi:SAM-dependent methyltransferase
MKRSMDRKNEKGRMATRAAKAKPAPARTARKAPYRKLNIGCGTEILPGYVNLDINKGPGIDVSHDLNKFPYPFPANHFDEIRAYSIIEHVADVIKTMAELHRILKPGGKLDIIVPHYAGPLAWGNPQHVRAFGYDTFHFFTKGYAQEHYTDALFSSIKVSMRFGKRWQVWNHLIERIANWFPRFYESTPMHIFPIHGMRIILIK